MKKPAGLHTINDDKIYDEDIDVMRRIDSDWHLVCQPNFEEIVYLKEKLPGVKILGRTYGSPELGISAWTPPYDNQLLMYMYGVSCGNQAVQYGIDLFQWANEPTIESNLAPTLENFQVVALGTKEFVRGFRSVTHPAIHLLGTIPLSPGNREDDYTGQGETWCYLGAPVLESSFNLCDVLLLHNYGTTDPNSLFDPYWGMRHDRQLAAYNWTKPWIISEWNVACLSDEQRIALSLVTENYLTSVASKPGCLALLYFIYDSRDREHHQQFLLKENHWVTDKFIALNARGVEEVPMNPNYIRPDVHIEFHAIRPAVAGQQHTISADLTVNGQPFPIEGLGMNLIHLPEKADGFAYGVDPVATDPELKARDPNDVDGHIEFTYMVPDLPDLTAPSTINSAVSFFPGGDIYPYQATVAYPVFPASMKALVDQQFPEQPIQHPEPQILPTPITPSVEVIPPPVTTTGSTSTTVVSVIPDLGGVSVIGGIRVDRLDYVLGQVWDAKDKSRSWLNYMEQVILFGKGELPALPQRPQ